MKTLENQICDVQNALDDLTNCLQPILDNKEQIVKKYGILFYTTLCSVNRRANSDACRIDAMIED